MTRNVLEYHQYEQNCFAYLPPNKNLLAIEEALSFRTIRFCFHIGYNCIIFLLGFGIVQLTSFHFILDYKTGVYKPTALCRMTLNATIPFNLSFNFFKIVASMLLFQKSAEQEWNPQPHERESFT
jgi:hypothetical protein